MNSNTHNNRSNNRSSSNNANIQRPPLPASIQINSLSSSNILSPPIPISLSLPNQMSANSTGYQQTANNYTASDNRMDTSGPISSASTAVFIGDVISRLYPNVNQQETPLPRQWSVVHKKETLKLSLGNLRVTYAGPGKTHKDAAAVRTDYVIPPACGIYYYEVKIISKGRDGYMGIGLSKSEVQLCRLPGWDKNSYGYHGDDGHSFCCSGTGQNYGPTFTTGDIIGCCLNLIDNTCFYTKNGYNLGIAFRDLPSDLYPTVGLQTPSESVEANFGQYPFEFDFHNYVKEWHIKTRQSIERFPLKKETENNLPIILRKLISTYLVHQGYSSTAEVFSKSVGSVFDEELDSIRNRQKIQGLVLNGQLGEAIELTLKLFPGVLEQNPNILFALKIREFIEMISNANKASNTTTDSPKTVESSIESKILPMSMSNHTNNHVNYNKQTHEEEMDMDSSPVIPKKQNNNELKTNDESKSEESKNLSFLEFDYENLQKILQYGRELFKMNAKLNNGENSINNKILRDAFSLLAYHDPWNSPLGYQLDPSQREHVSSILNSAILEANNMPRIPPLEVVYGQTNECMRLMAKNGVAWCAYVNLADYMQS